MNRIIEIIESLYKEIYKKDEISINATILLLIDEIEGNDDIKQLEGINKYLTEIFISMKIKDYVKMSDEIIILKEFIKDTLKKLKPKE